MMVPVNKCRWICKTDGTICDGGGMLPDLALGPQNLQLTADRARRWAMYIEYFTVPFANKGTERLWKKHLVRFALWREKHNGHVIVVLGPNQLLPPYAEEYAIELLVEVPDNPLWDYKPPKPVCSPQGHALG